MGVMDGHASDLRTGLPWQMVEIHEPVRILFVVETTPERMMNVVNANAILKRLIENRWIRLATIDPESGRVHVYRDGGFAEFDGPVERLPVALSSAEWYSRQNPASAHGLDSAEREAGKLDFPQVPARVRGAGPRSRVRAPGPAVAGGLGPVRARGFPDHEHDVFGAAVLALAGIVCDARPRPEPRRWTVAFGNWFAVHDYHFPLVLLADRLSLPFLALTAMLSGLIGQFSATYLHRERGFLRFFLLLHLFAFGSLLAFAAGSFDLLAAGWEIVGITSVLLIAFFQQRTPPVENALRVFAIYRACDIGLLVAIFAMHHWAGTASFDAGLPPLTGQEAVAVCLLLLLAASGKAAQVPFSGWLPRAMEGPTPSSAIFYGAISIHAGAYLLLRVQPLIAQSALASALVIALGAATAVHGTIVGRAVSDAKTSLAYASLTQVGVVFVEIGLGWTTDRGGPHPGARHGSDAAVPAGAFDAARLPRHALRVGRRDRAHRPASRNLSERNAVVALPLGARPRPPGYDPRSRRGRAPDTPLEGARQAGRRRGGPGRSERTGCGGDAGCRRG